MEDGVRSWQPMDRGSEACVRSSHPMERRLAHLENPL